MKVHSGLHELIKAIKRNQVDKIHEIMSKGININDYYYSMTPLSIAAIKGSVVIINILLSYGADINKGTHLTNFTPLSLAVTHGKKKAAYFLRTQGGIHEEKNIFVENLKRVYQDIEWNPYEKYWKQWEKK